MQSSEPNVAANVHHVLRAAAQCRQPQPRHSSQDRGEAAGSAIVRCIYVHQRAGRVRFARMLVIPFGPCGFCGGAQGAFRTAEPAEAAAEADILHIISSYLIFNSEPLLCPAVRPTTLPPRARVVQAQKPANVLGQLGTRTTVTPRLKPSRLLSQEDIPCRLVQRLWRVSRSFRPPEILGMGCMLKFGSLQRGRAGKAEHVEHVYDSVRCTQMHAQPRDARAARSQGLLAQSRDALCNGLHCYTVTVSHIQTKMGGLLQL